MFSYCLLEICSFPQGDGGGVDLEEKGDVCVGGTVERRERRCTEVEEPIFTWRKRYRKLLSSQ